MTERMSDAQFSGLTSDDSVERTFPEPMGDADVADRLDRWAEKHSSQVEDQGLTPDDVFRAATALRDHARAEKSRESYDRLLAQREREGADTAKLFEELAALKEALAATNEELERVAANRAELVEAVASAVRERDAERARAEKLEQTRDRLLEELKLGLRLHDSDGTDCAHDQASGPSCCLPEHYRLVRYDDWQKHLARTLDAESKLAGLRESAGALTAAIAQADAALDEFASHHPREDGRRLPLPECVEEAMDTLRAMRAALAGFVRRADLEENRAREKRRNGDFSGDPWWHEDHACAECVPGGSLVRSGFQCALHAARSLLGPSVVHTEEKALEDVSR